METFLEYLKAFVIGGALCAVGQILIDKTKLTPARILTSYVVVGVILGAVGVYEPFAEWAGAGATVPLTGFGNLLAKGVRKAVAEKGLLGIFSGVVTSALVILLLSLLFRLDHAMYVTLLPKSPLSCPFINIYALLQTIC